MKNNLAVGSLTVTPVLRLSSSQEIALDAVTVAPNDTASVWVNLGLLEHSPERLGQPGSYGSVVFRYNAADARNLHAVSIPQLLGTGIEFHNEAHPVAGVTVEPRAAGPGSEEGIWTQPRPGENDLLIVANSSEKSLAARYGFRAPLASAGVKTLHWPHSKLSDSISASCCLLRV